MRLLAPALGALALLAVFTALIWRQNRDLLRAGAYGEFFLRMIPPLSTGVFVAGPPFRLDPPHVDDHLPLLPLHPHLPRAPPRRQGPRLGRELPPRAPRLPRRRRHPDSPDDPCRHP